MPMLQTAINTYLKIERAPATTKNYTYALNRMSTAIGSQRDIRLISFADLLDYITRLMVKPSSKRAYIVAIKSFFTWCVTIGYLERSPAQTLTVRMPQEDPVDRAMPSDVLADMLAASHYKPRDYALISFLAATACRRGGAASLTISNLNLTQQSARILKKGGSPYTVIFDLQTSDALNRWLSVRPDVHHDYVFISMASRNYLMPLKPEGISSIIKKYAQRVAGVEYGPHSIRHRVGHAYAESGVPITVTADKLGHSNTKITERYYPRGTDDVLRQLADKIDPAHPQSGKIIRLPKRLSGE